MRLFGYFRSSAAYRVRIALNLKGIDYEPVPVNLVNSEQRSADYLAKNPQGLVPALETDQGLLTQSPAIVEWLEAEYPEPPLLPGDAWHQAQIRALAGAIACDIHPLNNLRVLKYLTGELGVSEEAKLAWYRHWIVQGFAAIEQQLGDSPFCFGDAPTLADVYLVPQVYNARRFSVDVAPYPRIAAIEAHCNQLEAFDAARPERQPDAPAA